LKPKVVHITAKILGAILTENTVCNEEWVLLSKFRNIYSDNRTVNIKFAERVTVLVLKRVIALSWRVKGTMFSSSKNLFNSGYDAAEILKVSNVNAAKMWRARYILCFSASDLSRTCYWHARLFTLQSLYEIFFCQTNSLQQWTSATFARWSTWNILTDVR
jgi:hypothetical protein